MPVTVTTASTAFNLATVEDLPSSVRGTNSSNDPHLDTLLTRASHAIASYLGRNVARQTYTEEVPGYGDTILQLGASIDTKGLRPGGPITSVTSVVKTDGLFSSSTANHTTITDAKLYDPMAMQLYRKVGWDWTAQVRTDLTDRVAPNTERPLYKAVYVSGFTLPQTNSTGTLPHDIRMACVNTVVSWFYQVDQDERIARIRVGDTEVQYRSANVPGASAIPQSLPQSSLSLLDRYRVAEV